MDFAELDGRSFAVVVVTLEGVRVIRGRGTYEHDSHLGRVLRVKPNGALARSGHPELLFELPLVEDQIRPDDRYGCDFTLALEFGSGNTRPGKSRRESTGSKAKRAVARAT
jgi:hypothetical protein